MKIAEVIQYEGDNKTVIWKHPIEDFNTNTQLIVHQSQEAIFFLNGEAMDTFGPGRHSLHTENIPFLTKALNLLTTDGKNPFHCEVYFVNKVEQMAIKWGTPEQFYFNEDIAGNEVPFLIGARGEMSIKVTEGRKLLLKLVGTEEVLSQSKLIDYFFGLVVSKVKSCISRTMRECKMSLFTVDEHLVELSEALKPLVADEFSDYGVEIGKFAVQSIRKPEGDVNYEKYKKIKFSKAIDIQALQLEQAMLNIEKQGEVERTIMESKGRAISRQQEGYTYQQERSFDVSEIAAANEGVGQYSNLGIGLGMVTGLSGTIGNHVGAMANQAFNGSAFESAPVAQQTAQPAADPTPVVTGIVCKCCNKELPADAMFCMQCGTKVEKAKFCKKCGSEIVEGAAFCMKCGEKVE